MMKPLPDYMRGKVSADEYDEEEDGSTVILEQESTHVPIFTAGNLSLVKGVPKSRKTTLMAALAAAMIGKPQLGMKALWEEEGVAYVDTEQGYKSCHITLRKILKLAGRELNKDCDRIDYFDYSGFTPAECLNFIRQMAGSEHYRIIFIDGLADICDDFNESKGCMRLVTKLMKIAHENYVHICACLHTNKNGVTEKGHLGALYKQKCETVLWVRKTEKDSNICEVVPDEEGCRHKPFEKFCFKVEGDMGLPVLCDGEEKAKLEKTAKAKRKKEKKVRKSAEELMRDYLAEALAERGDQGISRADMKGLIISLKEKKEGDAISPRRANEYISNFTKSGFLVEKNGLLYMHVPAKGKEAKGKQ